MHSSLRHSKLALFVGLMATVPLLACSPPASPDFEQSSTFAEPLSLPPICDLAMEELCEDVCAECDEDFDCTDYEVGEYESQCDQDSPPEWCECMLAIPVWLLIIAVELVITTMCTMAPPAGVTPKEWKEIQKDFRKWKKVLKGTPSGAMKRVILEGTVNMLELIRDSLPAGAKKKQIVDTLATLKEWLCTASSAMCDEGSQTCEWQDFECPADADVAY